LFSFSRLKTIDEQNGNAGNIEFTVHMGIVRGVKRDFAALERNRMAAIRLLRKGLNQSEVARRLRVRHQSVSRWAKTAADGEDKGLKAKGRPGPKPLLDEEDRQRLAARLREGKKRQTPPWTCDRVADLIAREFGIRYRPCRQDSADTWLWRKVKAFVLIDSPKLTANERKSKGIRYPSIECLNTPLKPRA
jgi:transposase